MDESNSMVADEPAIAAASLCPLAGRTLPAPRSAKGLDPENPTAMAARLERLLAHHRTLRARRGKGGFFVVDLGELGRRFAGRWPQARAKAHQLVEGIFARRLGAEDLYLALAGDRFLLLLTDLERAAAELLARRIAREITDRLCGMLPEGVACRLSTLPVDLETGLAGARSPAALAALVRAAEAPPEPPADTALAALTAGLEARYAPVLNVRKRLVSLYALSAGVRAEEPAPPGPPGDELWRAALDRWHVAQAAAALGSPAWRAALLLPVGYATIAGMRHREPLILACRRLPDTARRRLLIELHDLPLSLPQPRLRELVSYLRPFTVGIVLRLDALRLQGGAGSRDPVRSIVEQLAGSGVAALSLSLTGPKAADRPCPSLLLRTLAAAAHRLRSRTLCDVGADPAQRSAAVALGIDHLMGEAILPASRRPGRVIALGGGG